MGLRGSKFGTFWFLMGLGAQLQVWSSLCFTEAIALIAGPFLLVKNWHRLRYDGVALFCLLAFGVMLGCGIACKYNHTPSFAVLRGFAVTALLPCSIVVAHWMIRRHPSGFKWFLFGDAISMVLCAFMFQKSVDVTSLSGGEGGSAAAEAITSTSYFWAARLGPFFTLLSRGWYMQTPIYFDVCAVMFMSIFALLSTSSGRSSCLGYAGFVVLVLLGGKVQRTMKRFSRNLIYVFFLAILCVYGAKTVYNWAASSGLLGEEATKKYEIQMQGRKGILGILMGGRRESFIGYLACVNSPLIGYGPWAPDYGGFTGEFIRRFGTDSDFDDYLKSQAHFARFKPGVVPLIPCHAILNQFWCWYGIFGLVFWLYVLFVIVRFLRMDSWVVPQWYGWLVCWTPVVLWKIFFSPFSERFGLMLFAVACLMARAVRRGRIVLPIEMMKEIAEANRK